MYSGALLLSCSTPAFDEEYADPVAEPPAPAARSSSKPSWNAADPAVLQQPPMLYQQGLCESLQHTGAQQVQQGSQRHSNLRSHQQLPQLVGYQAQPQHDEQSVNHLASSSRAPERLTQEASMPG